MPDLGSVPNRAPTVGTHLWQISGHYEIFKRLELEGLKDHTH